MIKQWWFINEFCRQYCSLSLIRQTLKKYPVLYLFIHYPILPQCGLGRWIKVKRLNANQLLCMNMPLLCSSPDNQIVLTFQLKNKSLGFENFSAGFCLAYCHDLYQSKRCHAMTHSTVDRQTLSVKHYILHPKKAISAYFNSKRHSSTKPRFLIAKIKYISPLILFSTI